MNNNKKVPGSEFRIPSPSYDRKKNLILTCILFSLNFSVRIERK